MRISIGNIEYELTKDEWKVQAYFQGSRLADYITPILEHSPIVVDDLFNQNKKRIVIPSEIREVCNHVFDAIKLVKSNENKEEIAALLAARIFEAFTPYWKFLLHQGKDILGIYLWKEVLKITADWEAKNGLKIHTGTPNFFLAENYLLVGDRDLAFVYLYDALEDDKLLNTLAPVFEYPLKAPASYTATMNPNPRNKMYYIVDDMRRKLTEYIDEFNKQYNATFNISDFDTKFRNNAALGDVVSYFVYNFLFLVILEKNTKARSMNNDFSRLRSLDMFFNFCLVIDETLKVAYSIRAGRITGKHYISDSILWLSDSKGWMSRADLEDFWGKNHLKINDSPPDVIIPRLLTMNEQWKGRSVQKELFPLLIAYKFRNYGGHSIAQQHVITTQYDKIIQQLLSAFFIAVNEL